MIPEKELTNIRQFDIKVWDERFSLNEIVEVHFICWLNKSRKHKIIILCKSYKMKKERSLEKHLLLNLPLGS